VQDQLAQLQNNGYVVAKRCREWLDSNARNNSDVSSNGAGASAWEALALVPQTFRARRGKHDIRHNDHETFVGSDIRDVIVQSYNLRSGWNH
jgi:hypothetical protein